jgi:hypothetical protein
MAAGDLVVFPKFLEGLMDGSFGVDFNSMTTYCALVTTLTTAGIPSHDFWDDISGNEVSGSNYTAGGNSLSAQSVTTSSSFTIYNAADTLWAQHASGFTNARWAILYRNTGTGSTSALVAYLDLGSDRSNQAGDFTISWNANGILKVVAS